MKTICKKVKKILCCFIVMCAAFAVSGIFGVTSAYVYGEDYRYDEQAVLGISKQVTIDKYNYVFKIVADKTGIYRFLQNNDSYIISLDVCNSEMEEIKTSAYTNNNSVEFYALKGNTYYICLHRSSYVSDEHVESDEFTFTYSFIFEKEMEFVPNITCEVRDRKTYNDVLGESENFKFDSKSLTLEIKDYKGEAPIIYVKDMEENIGWDPKDVYLDDCSFKLKIIGNNTFDLDGQSSFYDNSKFITKFVGDGVLNIQRKSDENNFGLMIFKGLIVDGPIINFRDNATKYVNLSFADLVVSGDFEMISGEFNIDIKHKGFVVTGNAYLKGGKININISDSDNNCALDVAKEINFEGTDVYIDAKDIKVDYANYTNSIINSEKINYSDGLLYVKDDNYANIINTKEFNMTGGCIYANLASYDGDYGDVIHSWRSVDINGGDFVIVFQDEDEWYTSPKDMSLNMVFVYDGDIRNTINVDNAHFLYTSESKETQELLEKSNIDDLEYMFMLLNPRREGIINIGKNVKSIIGNDINKLGIELMEDSFIYDGTEKKPKLNLRGLREGIDVDVAYKDNVNVGEGKVIVTGKGFFTGTATFKFSIKGKNGNVSSKDKITNNSVNSIFNDGKYIYKIVKAAGKTQGKVSVIGIKKKSLKKINIKASVKHAGFTYKITSIGANAFKNNKKIKSVKIGKNVVKIGKKAFYNCKKLRKITIKSVKIKKVEKKAFAKTSKKLVIKVASKKKKAYFKKFKKAGFKGKIK